jgi:tRNA (guanine-N7-)-methyltransferase
VRRRGDPSAGFEYVPEDFFRPIGMAALFPREAPVEVDLGCGQGSFLVSMALQHPERNYIGTERLLGRVRDTSHKAARAGVTNLRLLRVESTHVASHLLTPGSVSRFYLLFPDPWPKRRHWPRRLFQPGFLQATATALQPRGQLWLKTDDADYFEHMTRIAAAFPHFSQAPWNEDLPPTDFERRYAAEGKPINAIRLVKM